MHGWSFQIQADFIVDGYKSSVQGDIYVFLFSCTNRECALKGEPTQERLGQKLHKSETNVIKKIAISGNFCFVHNLFVCQYGPGGNPLNWVYGYVPP